MFGSPGFSLSTGITTMTRKHFQLIADALQSSRPSGPADSAERAQWERTVDAVTFALSGTNPRFDHERFQAACSVQPKESA